MLTVVINLDAAMERMERISRIFEKESVQFHRIPALDGRDIRNADVISRYRSSYEMTIPSTDLACTISHRRAWEFLLSTNERLMAVFEDDCVFGRNFSDVLRDDWVPAGADIVKLETNHPEARLGKSAVASISGRNLYRLGGHHPGTAAYIISRKGARRMLQFTERNATFLDTLMFNHKQRPMLELGVYQLVPAICVQEAVLASAEGRQCTLDTYMIRDNREMFVAYAKPRKTVWSRAAKMGERLAIFLRNHNRFERLGRPQRIPFE